MKINSIQDINATPKEPKTERDCSHRQLFRPLWGSSGWRNNQRSGSNEKISAHSDFSPDPELLTPTESRHTTCLLGGKSPSVKLMSRRENKESGLKSVLSYTITSLLHNGLPGEPFQRLPMARQVPYRLSKGHRTCLYADQCHSGRQNTVQNLLPMF